MRSLKLILLSLLSIYGIYSQARLDRTNAFTVCTGIPSNPTALQTAANTGNSVAFYAKVFGIDVYAQTGWTIGDFQFTLGHIASILDPGQKGCVEDVKTINQLTTGGRNAAIYLLASGNVNPPSPFTSAYTYQVVVQWSDVQPPTGQQKGGVGSAWQDKTAEKVLNLMFLGMAAAYPRQFDCTDQYSQLYTTVANAIAQGSYQIPPNDPRTGNACDITCICATFFVNALQAKMGIFDGMQQPPPNSPIKMNGQANGPPLNSQTLANMFPDMNNLLSYSPMKSSNLGPRPKKPQQQYQPGNTTMSLIGCNKPIIANLAATYTCSVTALAQNVSQVATAAMVTAGNAANSPPQPKSDVSDPTGPTMSFRICAGLPTNSSQQAGLTDADSIGHYAQVFGIEVYAHSDWSTDKFQDFLGRVAQIFDNQQDGCPDDPNINKFLGNFGNRVAFFLKGRAGANPPATWSTNFKWSTAISWGDLIPAPVTISTSGSQSFDQATVGKKRKGAFSDTFQDKTNEKVLSLLYYGALLAYPSVMDATNTSTIIYQQMQSSISSNTFVAPTTDTITGSSTCDVNCKARAWFVNIVQARLGVMDQLTSVPSSVSGGQGGVKTSGGQPVNAANFNSSLPQAKTFFDNINQGVNKLRILMGPNTGGNRQPNGQYKPSINATYIKASCGTPLILNVVGLYTCGDTTTGSTSFLKYLQSSSTVTASSTANEPVAAETATSDIISQATSSSSSGSKNAYGMVLSLISIMFLIATIILQ